MIKDMFRKKKPIFKRDCLELTHSGGHCGPVFAPQAPSVYISAEYEDNNPVCLELRVSLEPSDWYIFEKQDFFLELIEWVRHLENADIPQNIGHLAGLKD